MNTIFDISTSDYDYRLPDEKIAIFPLQKRDDSRLLIYQNGSISEDRFYNLSKHLTDALLVLNDTKVIEARILFQKQTGAKIEIFCLEPFEQSIEQALQQKEKTQWQCMIGGASKWKPGQILEKWMMVAGEKVKLTATYIRKLEDSFLIEFNWDPPQYNFADIIHAAGNMPLPPYIKRELITEDANRYQTVFSKHEGSVAAPTAALHFTHELFNKLRLVNVETSLITLHVGAGTFKPVKSDTISGHIMHREPFTVHLTTLEKIRSAQTIIAVGTTSLRTLESIYWLGLKCMQGNIQWNLQQWEAYELADNYGHPPYQETIEALINWMKNNGQEALHCETSLLIVPGYVFHIPSALVTNFHQPQSTLLLLVSAFIGEDWKKVYDHALKNDFRFLSYGDSSLLWKNTF